MLQQPFQKCFWLYLLAFFIHFPKILSCFIAENPEALGPLLPKKTPVISTAIVKMVIERAVNIGTIVTRCSWSNAQILSPKDLYFSTNFSMVCLICATCVQRFFLFCDRICNHACTFSLSMCIGNSHLTLVAALQNFFNAWGFIQCL